MSEPVLWPEQDCENEHIRREADYYMVFMLGLFMCYPLGIALRMAFWMVFGV